MKKIFTLVLFAFSLVLSAQPIITGFSPASGPVGTAVTITGINFSTTPTDNIVYCNLENHLLCRW